MGSEPEVIFDKKNCRYKHAFLCILGNFNIYGLEVATLIEPGKRLVKIVPDALLDSEAEKKIADSMMQSRRGSIGK